MYLAGVMVFYAMLGSLAAIASPSSPHAIVVAASRQDSSSSEPARPQDESKVPSQETPPSETKSGEPSQTRVGEPSNQQTPATSSQPSTGKQQEENPQAGSEQAGPAATSSTNKSTQPSSNTRHRKRKHAKTPNSGPRKIVVHNGGTTEPTALLAPGMTEEQASHRRQNITQLLVSTDDNVKKISGRPLNSSQQATLDQIRAYMQQAKSAADSGDLERGHNLATKAHLLADDLLKH
jgi:hypothetical protein